MPRGKGRKNPRGKSADGTPNPIDVYVGSRIRTRRTLMGMSQQKLGEAIGLTFQQVQKYERGTNRVGSSRMFELSNALNVSVGYFFDEMESSTAANGRSVMHGAVLAKQEPRAKDPMQKRETLELVRAYYKITNPRIRKRLFEMTKTLAQAEKPVKSAP